MQVLLLLDADFIASAGLHEFLTQSDKAADLMEDLVDNRRVIVLPAFETEASLGVEAGGEMALKAQASASSAPPSASLTNDVKGECTAGISILRHSRA